MNESRVTDEEAAEAARVLRKIEELDLLGDTKESWALTSTRKRLEQWVENKTGILSLQGFQDEEFKERASDALLDEDQAKHDKWMALVRPEARGSDAR